MNGLGDRSGSLKLGGTIVCWLPNPYGIVGSLEFEAIVTVCGSNEATEEMLFVSLDIAPGSCVKLRTAGVLVRAGFPSVDERST